ncbi:hypothetical protein H7F16_04185 [Gemmobacter straminiformis]|uniref:Winged helix-turn-helix domain-containing protein n=1 Tax=Paragemmobacter straminiformis TaxID=2045119 RepID=A0A842I529_9RHOB|nr:helix-turn-helix domain-containing protein [Gemmobacter straminiformis]MBC2834691.1 hypothetical protein [Gemmobacter straminiformis]
MNAAPLHSPRLQKVLRVLREGKPVTTRQIVRRAGVMAVNACVAELRQHGAEIICQPRVVNGARRFFYTMTKEPTL